MSEESDKAVRHKASLLASLPKIEAFQALLAIVEQKSSSMVEILTRRMLGGEDMKVLQRQIDYDRGFLDGMKYLAKAVPAGAESRLQRSDLASHEVEQPEDDYWAYGGE